MKYRWLGSSGLLVSRISLGTMTFGTDNWGCGEKESHAIMRAYVDAGGNLIDCADVYAAGRSEEIIGAFLPQVNRDELVIASKCYFPMGQKPNQYGVSRKHIFASCEASLKRLRTDYIDLYYIHGPDPVTPYEETLRALDEVLNASPATLVDSVVFDGRVTAVDPATGKAVTPLLLSLQVERGAFEEILLDEPELDPCCA